MRRPRPPAVHDLSSLTIAELSRLVVDGRVSLVAAAKEIERRGVRQPPAR